MKDAAIDETAMLKDRRGYLRRHGMTQTSAVFNTAAAYDNAMDAGRKGHTLAYVCVYGGDYVAVVDLATNTRLLDIAVGSGPLGITINNDGSYAYVSNFFDNTVSMIDLKYNEVVNTVTVGSQPVGLKTSPDGKYLYVAQFGELFLRVLDALTLQTVTDIPVPSPGFQIDTTVDGALAFVTLRSVGEAAVIDLAVNLLVKTFLTGTGAEDVKVSPTDLLAFVSNEDGDTLTPINVPLAEPASPNIVSRSMPVGLAYTDFGRTLYCANRNDQSVSVFDVFTHAETVRIAAGSGPYGAASADGGNLVVVSNSYSDNISIIDTASNTITATVVVGSTPTFLAILSRCGQ